MTQGMADFMAVFAAGMVLAVSSSNFFMARSLNKTAKSLVETAQAMRQVMALNELRLSRLEMIVGLRPANDHEVKKEVMQ